MRNGMIIRSCYPDGDHYRLLLEGYMNAEEDEYCKNDVESTKKRIKYFETDDLKRNILDEYVDTDTEIMKYIEQRIIKPQRDYVQSTLKQKLNERFGFNMIIKKVIFSDPCTIVLWGDGTKTIVRCENEEFDKEKGLAMAIAKKALGNTSKYYDTFKNYIKEEK